MSTLSVVLLVVLIALLIGAFPVWPYSAPWGYRPVGLGTLLLIVLIVLIATGRL